jgi:hypothetical protein
VRTHPVQLQYDVLFEVDTEELTEELYRVGQFEGTTQLLVESHEEGWLAKRLVEADGQRPLQVRQPVCFTGKMGLAGRFLNVLDVLEGELASASLQVQQKA